MTELVALLDSPRWQTVRAAAEALGALRADAAIPALSSCTIHRHWRVREAAVRALGDIPHPDAAEALADVVERGIAGGQSAVASACVALGRLRSQGVDVSKRATTALLGELRDLPPNRKWPQVYCLGALRDPWAEAPLLELLATLVAHDLSPGRENIWRRGQLTSVLVALSRCGADRARDAVAALPTKVPEELLPRVDETLIELGDKRGLDHLMAQVRAGSPHSWQYVYGLTRLSAPWTIAALRELAESEDTSIRRERGHRAAAHRRSIGARASASVPQRPRPSRVAAAPRVIAGALRPGSGRARRSTGGESQPRGVDYSSGLAADAMRADGSVCQAARSHLRMSPTSTSLGGSSLWTMLARSLRQRWPASRKSSRCCTLAARSAAACPSSSCSAALTRAPEVFMAPRPKGTF